MFNSWPSLCKINCITCSVYLLIAKAINFKMFCFVVLLMDGIVLVGFTKSIFCWNWAGSHTQLSSGSEFPSAEPVVSSWCTEVISQAWFFGCASVKRLYSPSGGTAGFLGRSVAGCLRLLIFEAGKAHSYGLNFHHCCCDCHDRNIQSRLQLSEAKNGPWGW